MGIDLTRATAAVDMMSGADLTRADAAQQVTWIYKTKAGTVSVHFQNAVVVDIDPADFPVEAILE